MESHLHCLIGILVVHVVDDVQSGNVLRGQPVHEFVNALHDVIEFQILAGREIGLRTNLHMLAVLDNHLVLAAVDGVKKSLGQVGAGAEELHSLADNHGGYAAGNGVVIAVEVRAHEVVILVLNGRGVDGNLGGELLPGSRELFRPEDGHVGLRGSAHVVKGLQVTEAGLGYQGSAVEAHAAERFGGPDRIAGEQGIVFRSAEEAYHAELHDHVVNQFLSLLLGEHAVPDIAFDVDIVEGGGTAVGHGSAVLGLNSSQITEIGGLHGFLGGLCRAGNIAAVGSGHLLEFAESLPLFLDFLAGTNGILKFSFVLGILQLSLIGIKLSGLVSHESINAVEGNATVVADDAAAAVGIRKTG